MEAKNTLKCVQSKWTKSQRIQSVDIASGDDNKHCPTVGSTETSKNGEELAVACLLVLF